MILVTCMKKMAAKNVSLRGEGSHWRSTMVDGLASSTSPFGWCMEQAKTPKFGAASFSFIYLFIFFGWKHSLIVAWSAKEVVALVAQLYNLFCFVFLIRVWLVCLSMIHYNVSTVFFKLNLPKLKMFVAFHYFAICL